MKCSALFSATLYSSWTKYISANRHQKCCCT